MDISKRHFGTLPDGTEIYAYTLANTSTFHVTVLTYGGIIQSLKCGGCDLVLGYETLDPYLENPAYFGAAIGRVANRIRNGQFEIDGVNYHLPRHDNGHNLHSGPRGFEHSVWDAEINSDSLVLRLIEADGTNGFPGTLDIAYRFTVKDTALQIDIEAKTDKATVCNPTHHSYFNLGGFAGGARSDIESHTLKLYASEYTPTDADGMPLGTLRAVADTKFDFQDAALIGQRAIDHNFSVAPLKTNKRLRSVAALSLDRISLILESTLPGLQIYTGDFIPDCEGKDGAQYSKRAGLAMEPQYFPDAPNCPAFENFILRPNETYAETIRYTFKP